jgi:hypothetical protein
MPSTPILREARTAAGRSLHELLAAGERPDRATLVDWGCQLLEILGEAHARGVLHRHLTEEEVIVTHEGRVVLTGFGMTRLSCDLLVTPPPEQLAGGLYTAQSDLYAVGSLLRRLAFAAGALRAGRGSFGSRDPLLKVLARATFVDPAGRYQTAKEMADALREAGRAEAGPRPRHQDGSSGAGAQVKSFPVASLRLVAERPAAPPAQEGDDGGLWRALLLLVASLLLLTFVLAGGWFLLERGGSVWAGGQPAATHPAPVVRPVPPAAASH